jgi:FkbM family methyltransferase
MAIPDLIFDIGMSHGEDTAHYLAKGFRVVAVEANPVLAEECRREFSEVLNAGRLFIEQVAVAETPGIKQFWVNATNDRFSALDQEAGQRGGAFHVIDVASVTFADLLSKYGVPFYLKIDIEGADINCLLSLDSSDLPKYVSIEAHKLEYLLILWRLGYRDFKVIDQTQHNSRAPNLNLSNERVVSRALKRLNWYIDRVDIHMRRGHVTYAPGSSGPFAEETRGPWLSLEEVAYNWLHFHRGYHDRGTLNPGTWYDFHARL